ncbi:methyltransferase family protein [Hyphomicrobium sp.]|uniref:methyltransferase family protein n=1 Tax=Hyphomicrobium sp. TaxID=82 RepID=UPI002FE137B9
MTLTYTQPARDLSAVQYRRRIILGVGIFLICFLLPFVCAVWLHTNPLFYSQIEHAGIFLIFVAIAGRTWSALHIGGYKKVALIETGPYSIVRNPLYLFTLIGAAGIGAQTSSLVMVAVCTSMTAAVLVFVVSREEDYLRKKFGAAFEDYASRVPRFLPRFRAYRDAEQLVIQPKVVYRTFLESSYFLVAVPAVDAIELARYYGWLPDLLHLP